MLMSLIPVARAIPKRNKPKIKTLDITLRIKNPFDDLSFNILLLIHNKNINNKISSAQYSEDLISSAAKMYKNMFPPFILHYF